MPTDERPFIEAILANPADQAPRLIYADGLDLRTSTAVLRASRGGVRTVPEVDIEDIESLGEGRRRRRR